MGAEGILQEKEARLVTTVAWDGETLATDSLSTQDGIRDPGSCRKLWSRGDKHLAGAGDYTDICQMADWLIKGKSEPKFIDPNFVIIFVEKNKAYLYDNSTHRVPFKGNEAQGTGRVVALTAMKLGQSAVEAVKTAISLMCSQAERSSQ